MARVWRYQVIDETLDSRVIVQKLLSYGTEVFPKKSFDGNREFYTYSQRIKTFKNWKLEKPSPECLSEAGFWFTGFGDRVECFYCESQIEHWRGASDPFQEHYDKFRNVCSYITMVVEMNLRLLKKNVKLPFTKNTHCQSCGTQKKQLCHKCKDCRRPQKTPDTTRRSRSVSPASQ